MQYKCCTYKKTEKHSRNKNTTQNTEDTNLSLGVYEQNKYIKLNEVSDSRGTAAIRG